MFFKSNHSHHASNPQRSGLGLAGRVLTGGGWWQGGRRREGGSAWLLLMTLLWVQISTDAAMTVLGAESAAVSLKQTNSNVSLPAKPGTNTISNTTNATSKLAAKSTKQGPPVGSPTNHVEIIPKDRPWEQLGGSNLNPASVTSVERSRLTWFQTQLDQARLYRQEKKLEDSDRILTSILESDSPREFKRAGLYELALVAEEMNQLGRAQQILAQFMSAFPKDPAVPEALLRQGLIYRQMGSTSTALKKFYLVLTSSLALKLDRLDYYRRLVLQAKTEIADTHFLDGDYLEASEKFELLLRETSTELNRAQITVKWIRCLSRLGRHTEVNRQAEAYFKLYEGAMEFPEVRYLNATALKRLERNTESIRQVLLLLNDTGSGPQLHPQNWFYWRQRAGNDIANQLYKEADFMNALQIYLGLAELDGSPGWQFPVWYQVGLVYERLEQSEKAGQTFAKIEAKAKILEGSALTPALKEVVEMAQWRMKHLQWQSNVLSGTLDLKKMTAAKVP